MGRSKLAVGAGLLTTTGARQADTVSAFHRDGRHFLKQLANALGLSSSTYTIVTRHAGATSAGEVVMRTGRLLVVISRDSSAATLSFCAIEPGVSVAREDVTEVSLADLQRPEAQEVLVSKLGELAAAEGH